VARVKAKPRETEPGAKRAGKGPGRLDSLILDSSSEISGISVKKDFRYEGFFDASLVRDTFLSEGFLFGVDTVVAS